MIHEFSLEKLQNPNNPNCAGEKLIEFNTDKEWEELLNINMLVIPDNNKKE